MARHFGFLFILIALLEFTTGLIFGITTLATSGYFLLRMSPMMLLFLVLGIFLAREEIKRLNYSPKLILDGVIREYHGTLLFFALISSAFFIATDPKEWMYLTRAGVELSIYFAFMEKRNR